MKRLLSVLFFALSALASNAQTSIKVETHNVVALDEQFNVTFIIEGSKPTDFEWEPAEGFTLIWGPQSGRSTSVQIINGKRTESSKTTYSYILKPTNTGKFLIPRAKAKVKGKEIFSTEHTVEVVASEPAQQSGTSQKSNQSRSTAQVAGMSDNDLFMNLSVDRSNVVVGEPLTATLKLYQRVNITGFEGASFPSFNGFWSQEIDTPTNIEFTRETYKGQIYNTAVIRKFLLIPQQTGQLTIDPAELVCLVNVRVSSGGTSIFDGFFDDYRTVRKKVASAPLKVNVMPLPSGAPASFAGGVGNFTISASVSKDTLMTHDAASLVVTVSGKGNISLLETPKVSFPPDMEVYDCKVASNVANGGLSGSKKYDFPFIPRSYGDFVIEPIKYSYYDINAKKYVTLQTDPIPITVLRGNETESSVAIMPGLSRKDVKNLDDDIRYINVKSADLVPKGQFLMGSMKLWIIMLILILTAIAAWLSLRTFALKRADVAGTRNRKATKMALKRLKLADTFLTQNLYTAFYEELHKALLGFISDKLNMPSSELSRDRIAELLKKENVAEDSIAAFIRLLDDCEFARYSPSTGNEAMAAHYEAAADLISTIDASMKSRKSSGKMALMLVFLTMAPFAADARDDMYVDSLWNAANIAYSQGQWADAVADYEMISDMGLESAALYCNAGNAYFKDGNIAKAILYYERALKMDPSYEDAIYNLSLANDRIQDRIDVVPEFFLKKWMRDICYLMDSDAWAVAFIIFLAATLALLLMFILAPSAAGRRVGFFTGLVTLILMVFSISFSVWQKNEYMNSDKAIVIKPVASVKSSPSTEATKDLFILHEGTKVEILDRVGEWNNISLSDGRQGWLPAADMEVI